MPAEIIPVIAGGLIGGSITMISWFVTDIQRRRDAVRNRRADFIQRQIYELYAPLHALAKLDHIYRQTRERVCKSVSVNERLKIWSIYTDDFVIPTQLKIYDLLQSKWYLLADSVPPRSFEKVLEHCSAALSLYALAKKGLGDFSEVVVQGMPEDLIYDVESALEELRGKHQEMLGSKREPEPREVWY